MIIFKNQEMKLLLISLLYIIVFQFPVFNQTSNNNFKLNDQEYFETRGFNVLVFNNWYSEYFGDSKITGIEFIHHEVRTATNGDVRLSPTPEQWDPIPKFIDKKANITDNSIEVFLSYPEYDFNYSINVKAENNNIIINVILNKPLPEELVGIAGFNLEFLPAAYFSKAYIIDEKNGIFPLYPSGPMQINKSGIAEPKPIASGKVLTLAPEDPARRVIIKTTENDLLLYDGRNKAQNGWYIVRSLIPANKSGKVIEWDITINTILNWIRSPMIAYSQVGYHPEQKKVAIIEFDMNDKPLKTAQLLKVDKNGNFEEMLNMEIEKWGKYLRYNYYKFDFSSVMEKGLYVIEYGNVKTSPFRIAPDVYENAWQLTLDVFFPVQMDHMLVNEAYRVWHGASHLDDALQAPINHKHFDLYAQGPTTDSPYKAGEHIPGLNIGGWFDAGDFDIRTQTQYHTTQSLVDIWETFNLQRDETLIDQEKRYVDIHVPDGIPDILQQIEHGTLALIAQHRSVGHAIPGIIVPDLSQYTHLGDAITMTDNLVYNPELDSFESNGFTSGKFDDRWAFTSKSSPLNYGSIAALAAASRALKGYNDELANECLTTAKKVWDEENSHEPDIFTSGNTTGGKLEDEKLKAAVELLICTKDTRYSKAIEELWPSIEKKFMFNSIMAVKAIPFMNESYLEKIKELVREYKNQIDTLDQRNPFGVPISIGGWGGNGWAIYFGINNYYLHKAFPEIIDLEDVYKGLNYIYGCHPGSNISFVSGVGTHSKKVAYGNNRADYSFIAGGIVPGALVIKPDFPENKEDWPFLWGENEYVIGMGGSYIFLVNAVNELLNSKK